jgi:xylulokinase
MGREAALGFDVGTTAVKAGLLWLDGDEPMQVVSRAYPTARPRDDRVEQDPTDWISAMASCWTELSKSASDVRLRSVGVCSQVNTHLLVDDGLRPLRPAITWQDTRAVAEASELDALAEGRRLAFWAGPFTIDASFSLARLLWLTRHEPDSRATARWLLQPRDFCVAALTGELTAEPLSQIGLVGADGLYIDGVLDLVDGAVALLPALRRHDRLAGEVLPGNAVGLPGGVPVAVGTMDAWGSIFGAGLGLPGRAMDLAGTSEVVAVSSERSVPTRGLVSFPPIDGVHVHAGPTQAGGAALEWAAAISSLSVSGALALAAEASHHPQSLVFLPHLAGERAPYWNPDARGVFMGMTTTTQPGHLVQSVLEGVAFSVRMLLERCEEAAGLDVPTLRVCGGGARSELWNQVKATTVGRPVELLTNVDAGVLGAALLGMVGADSGKDLAALAEQHVRIDRIVDPSADGRSRLDDLYGVYVDAYQALEPLFPRLGTAGSP